MAISWRRRGHRDGTISLWVNASIVFVITAVLAAFAVYVVTAPDFD